MLAHSIPRAVRSSCPQPTSRAAVLGAAAAATLSAPHTRASHQRRRSSSKASWPPGNGQRSSDQAANNPSALESERRSSPRDRIARRKGNAPESEIAKARDGPFANVPQVPSTQHVNPADLSVSSFFSLHRPISVTTAFPPLTSMDQFNDIFGSSTKPQDSVIYVWANTAETQKDEQGLRREILNNSTTHGNVKQLSTDSALPFEELTKHFRMFNKPPPPIPFEEPAKETSPKERKSLAAQQSREAEEAEGPHVRPIQQSQKQDSKEQVLVQVPQKADTGARRAPKKMIRGRPSPAITFARYIQRLSTRSQRIWAISVKRQRRLKMKKHKYKKRMRATRTIRKREGRL